jgi:hypothetical protein
MAEPALIEQHREFVRAVQRVAAQSRQAEAEAKDILDKDLEAAEAARTQLGRAVQQELSTASRLVAEAQRLLGMPVTPGLPADIVPIPPLTAYSHDLLGAIRTQISSMGAPLLRIRAARADEAPKSSQSSGVLLAFLGGVLAAILVYLVFRRSGEDYGLGLRDVLLFTMLPALAVVSFFFVRGLFVKPYVPDEDYAAICIALGHTLYLAQAQMEDAQSTYERRIAERRAQYEQAVNAIEQQLRQQLLLLNPERARLIGLADAVAPEWSHPGWHEWTPPTVATAVTSLGELFPGKDDDRLSVPALLAFPDSRSVLFKAGGSARERATRAVQSLLFRLLASHPPDSLRFTLIDPVGQGRNLADFVDLADFATAQSVRRAWYEPIHVEQRLAELDARIDSVAQKLDYSQSTTLAQHNARVGPRLAEPYRIVVVLDFPNSFDATAVRHLARIVQLGPAAGVYTLLAVDADQPMLYGPSMADIERASVVIAFDGAHFVWHDEDFKDCLLDLDTPPEPTVARRILELSVSAMT